MTWRAWLLLFWIWFVGFVLGFSLGWYLYGVHHHG